MKWTIAMVVAVLVVIFTILASTSPSDVLIFTTQSSDMMIMFAAMVGSLVSQKPLIHRGEISQLLKTTLGVELGRSTIAKLFSPAVGQGCKPACYWGRRPLYRVDDVLAWANARLRHGPGMTAISAKEMPADDIPAKGSEPAARTTDPHL
jgi:hypothetical protein